MSAGLLHEGFVRRAAEGPEAPAVAGARPQDPVLSYGELLARARRVAADLLRAGIGPGDRVAVVLPKGADAYAAILGVLLAGAAYAPVDPRAPLAHRRRILALLAPKRVLDEPPGAAGVEASTDLGPATPEDPAYVLATSGSTGAPKGVVVRHRNARHFVDWALAALGPSPGELCSAHPPLHFDLSVLDLFATLAAGATVVPVPERLALLPARLALWIRARGLAQWFSVPSVLGLVARAGFPAGGFPALRRVLACGEVLPPAVAAAWRAAAPEAALWNLYGPTETTVASTAYELPAELPGELRALPIGRPLPGEEAVVLDPDGRPCRPGEVGELLIAGAGVAAGYLGDPARTAAAFGTWTAADGRRLPAYRTGDLAARDEQGLLWFHGRADDQVKIRGHRIELGAVDAALAALPELLEAAAFTRPAPEGLGPELCAAYVPAAGARAEPAELRRALAAILPAAQVPSAWFRLARLPRGPSGKIDRRALRNLADRAP